MMNPVAVLVLVCANMALLAHAQVPQLAPCPKLNAMENFDVNQYLGKWYEAEKYFAVFEAGGKCITATYSANDDGSVAVENTQTSSISGATSSIKGFATVDANTTQAKLSVTFPSLPVQNAAPYWVMDTDYTGYAVVWSCEDYYNGFISTRFAWILTRERNPEISTLEKAYKVVDKNNIDRGLFLRTDQQNCPEDH